MSNDFYQWDHHSDQPHVIRDKKAKRKLYIAGAAGSLKTFLVGLFVLPFVWLLKQRSTPVSLPAPASRIGLCVNLESALAGKRTVSAQEQASLVKELDVRSILIRIPLADASSLEPYQQLVAELGERQFLIDILQDRQHIENPALYEQALRQIFSTFAPHTSQFKIGNAINRRKWAFVSLDEYFHFFALAQQLRDREFPNLALIGAGIIDFELPNFARSLIHCAPIRYDGTAALLYVDRRGAPENRQLGANLLGKIHWFDRIMHLSNKTTHNLHITETNWPLAGTEPYAPAVGDCMVDESKQAAYLARYYLLAFASGKVASVYWHQLVAPGYGLVDNRGTDYRKRDAFYALKTLCALFQDTRITAFDYRDGLYILSAETQQQRITAIWTNDVPRTFQIATLQVLHASSSPDNIQILDLLGNPVTDKNTLRISGDVTYFVQWQAE